VSDRAALRSVWVWWGALVLAKAAWALVKQESVSGFVKEELGSRSASVSFAPGPLKQAGSAM
jgi:hypothetical protein